MNQYLLIGYVIKAKRKIESIAYYAIDSHGNIKASSSQIRIETISSRLLTEIPFPHKHKFFQLIIVASGSGWHEIDFKRHKVGPRKVFLMKPGQVHELKIGNNVTGFVLEFNRESLDINIPVSTNLLNRITNCRLDVISLQTKEFKSLIAICEQMHLELHDPRELSDICLQGYITGIFVQIVRFIGKENQNMYGPQCISEKFQQLVNNHYKEKHSVEFYAKTLGVSSKTLKCHLRKTHNKPPRQLIQERFLLEAKRLLTYSDLTIAEVGYEVGFNDPNYFSRFFRIHEKITPQEFQKKFRDSVEI